MIVSSFKSSCPIDDNFNSIALIFFIKAARSSSLSSFVFLDTIFLAASIVSTPMSSTLKFKESN